LEFNVPFQHKYGYIRDDVNHRCEQTCTKSDRRDGLI